MALDTADRAEELLRVGVWSVRRHTAGLVFVNTETGCAQAEAPREVLADLGLEEDGGLGLGAPRTEAAAEGGDAGGQAELGSTSATSRPWSVSSGGQAGERGGDSALEHPLGAEEASPRFHRILLGSERGMPLAMARDIVAALREDASLFEVVRKKFSDLPMETEIDMGSLSEELGGIAATLRPGEFSGVIGTEAGMQILLRVC